MSKGFASQGDLAEKQETFSELAPGVYALTAEGDPNSGIVVGDDSVLVIDARATPRMAGDLVARVREVTDKPIRHILLTHYHAVRVLGVAGYPDRVNVIASDVARAMIVERGQQDMDSEIQRFPRLFRGREEIPGLTWPTLTFHGEMTLWLGSREVRIVHAGRGHTAGDTIAWLPKEKVLFSGDLVEYGATPYCGDAHFQDWPATLDRLEALGAAALVPGRGEALTTPERIREGLEGTRAFLRDLYAIAREGVAAGHDLKAVYARAMGEMRPTYGHWVIFEHCMPFDVSRAYDEAKGIDTPRIWTAARDIEMWRALEG
ncbi:MBL fold metallo-hydrolase [Methylobacterium platani]|uniref:MBL fold metallo-hydrolase n=2 Tax=Methylobacterium platani TaxID=427683 RepID=A0A179S4Q2_9HYPH|nr:MBL fold metallo-hydrolase [Methylobacterium platani]KMO21732.1 beta-lactamase [Methylobacterium platani JCM 14648]OAS19186.1 MBL fold metallo-hydrolase [Methylobacterium platani]